MNVNRRPFLLGSAVAAARGVQARPAERIPAPP